MFGANENTVRIRHPHLPWQIGGLAFLVYAVTLCHSVTLKNLTLASQVAGWSAPPATGQPLLWLLTAPLKLLPDIWIPPALNLLSALLAALTLVFLARSVQLLPLNRLRVQWIFLRHNCGLLESRNAWLPVVVACLMCGLGLGFWQEAVSATGDMLDLLLLAIVVWLLLEFRLSDDVHWLFPLAVVWGMGMAENWVMIAALPVLVLLLICLWGLASLLIELWVRMLFGWLAGFSLFLLLPVVNSLSPHAPWTFQHAFRESFLTLKSSLASADGQFFHAHASLAFLLALFYALPLLPIMFRLNFDGSYHLSLQARLELLMFQVLFAVMLVTELWLSLQPLAGPQNLMAENGFPPLLLLSLALFNALGAGYLTAHFLLICSSDVKEIRRRNSQFELPPFLPPWFRAATVPVLYALPVILLLGLGGRNLGLIRDFARSPLTGFGQTAAACLPPGGGLVVSDDSQRLELVLAALARRPDYHRWVPVDVSRLADPHYRSALERKWPLGWLDIETEPPAPAALKQLLLRLAVTNQLYSLQAHLDLLADAVNVEPHGLVFRLTPQPPAGRPALSPGLIRENEQFWDQAWTNRLAGLTHANLLAASHPAVWQQFFRPVHPDSDSVQLAAQWHAVALSNWADTLHHAGQEPASRHRLQQAHALTADDQLPVPIDDSHDDQSAGPVKPPPGPLNPAP